MRFQLLVAALLIGGCQTQNSGQCLSGQVFVNGQCFTPVQIGSACQRNEQCIGGSTCQQNICQCQQGFAVVNRQCVANNGLNCALGTVLFNSQCISLSSPGQNCVTSPQCIDNSQCVNGVCTCPSNFNMVYGYCIPFTGGPCQLTQTLANNQCVLYSIVGQNCIANNQCVGGSTCMSGTCQCNQGATAMYGYCINSAITNCGTTQVSINNQCFNTAQIGFQCSFSQQCLGNSQCMNSICQCPQGSTNNNGQCSGSNNFCSPNQVLINNQCFNTAQIGFQCSFSQQCLGNSQCMNSICQCPQGSTNNNGQCSGSNNFCSPNQVLINNQCFNTAQIGFQCSFSQQCLGNSQCMNSICQCPQGSTNNNGQCSGSNNFCSPNQVLINNQCFNTAQIGFQCSFSQQCLGNSQCMNSICQCPQGSTNNNGQCSGSNNFCSPNQVLINNQCFNTAQIGFQCSFSQQCLGNSQCMNSICQCPQGSTNNNGQCSGSNNFCSPNQVLINNQCFNTAQIGFQCSFSQQCLGNSQCMNSICQCPQGSTNNNGQCSGSNNFCSPNQVLINNQCFNTAQIGFQCSFSQQCLGNSQCMNSICQCPQGSTNNNGQCSGSNNFCSPNQVLINNQCFNTAQIGFQCSFSQQCLGNSQCMNSICQCPQGSTNNNGQCSGSNNFCSPNQVLINNQCFNTAQIGFQCSFSQQCLGNSQCMNSICQCPQGSTNNNGQCSGSNNFCSPNQVLINNQCFNTAQIGFQCSFSQQCLGNSQCFNGICQCPQGSTNNNGICSQSNSGCSQNQVLINNQCWVVASIGGACTFSQQCLGNSFCSNSVCQCPVGSSNLNGMCSTQNSCGPGQILVNGQCTNGIQVNGQCSVTAQCLSGASCLGGFCLCPQNAQLVNGICSSSSGSNNFCPANQQVQLSNTGTPVDCLRTTCAAASQCLFSSAAQQYVCCR